MSPARRFIKIRLKNIWKQQRQQLQRWLKSWRNERNVEMISKRTYRGEKFFLIELEQAFNVLKNRTARIEEDRNGAVCCYVEGWSDTDAAAVWLLVNSGVRGSMLTE